jgi:hypothetical protein
MWSLSQGSWVFKKKNAQECATAKEAEGIS